MGRKQSYEKMMFDAMEKSMVEKMNNEKLMQKTLYYSGQDTEQDVVMQDAFTPESFENEQDTYQLVASHTKNKPHVK